MKDSIINFCTQRSFDWHLTPDHAPHFGGLWVVEVKSFIQHFRRVVGDVRLTFEELPTTLAWLNSRPITRTQNPEEGIRP